MMDETTTFALFIKGNMAFDKSRENMPDSQDSDRQMFMYGFAAGYMEAGTDMIEGTLEVKKIEKEEE